MSSVHGIKGESELATLSFTKLPKKMPRFQLPIAVVLVLSALASIVVFYLTPNDEGKIKLPVHSDEDEERFTNDPFDVTTPQDVTDGYPVDPEGFWRRVSGLETSAHRGVDVF